MVNVWGSIAYQLTACPMGHSEASRIAVSKSAAPARPFGPGRAALQIGGSRRVRNT